MYHLIVSVYKADNRVTVDRTGQARPGQDSGALMPRLLKIEYKRLVQRWPYRSLVQSSRGCEGQIWQIVGVTFA